MLYDGDAESSNLRANFAMINYSWGQNRPRLIDDSRPDPVRTAGAFTNENSRRNLRPVGDRESGRPLQTMASSSRNKPRMEASHPELKFSPRCGSRYRSWRYAPISHWSEATDDLQRRESRQAGTSADRTRMDDALRSLSKQFSSADGDDELIGRRSECYATS